MSYQQGNSRPQVTPRKKSFLNDWRQPHPATDGPVDGGKYPAQFMWEITNAGKVVMKISDGVFKEGAKSPHKEVEISAYDRGIFFETLLEAANPLIDFKMKQFQVKKRGFVRTGGQSRMSDQPITFVTLTITREPTGAITLTYSKGDYKVTTHFKGPNQSVILVRNDAGEIVEDTGFMSRMYTRSWVNFHQPVLDRMELEGWEPPKPRDDSSSNFNNNRNQGNPNQSNMNKNFDDFDDDIAF